MRTKRTPSICSPRALTNLISVSTAESPRPGGSLGLYHVATGQRQPNDPYGQHCYDKQNNDLGGVELGSYCCGLYSDASQAALEGPTIGDWT
jgi:hypothetical protein